MMLFTHEIFGSGYYIVEYDSHDGWTTLRKDYKDGSYSLVADYFENLEVVENRAMNEKFDNMLKAAFIYYWGDGETGMTDHEYDTLTNEVALHHEKISCEYKEIVDFQSLKVCSSLYYISKASYPDHIK